MEKHIIMVKMNFSTTTFPFDFVCECKMNSTKIYHISKGLNTHAFKKKLTTNLYPHRKVIHRIRIGENHSIFDTNWYENYRIR